MADFNAAFGNLVPSLTLADLDRYDKLEQQYAPERQRAKGLGGAASSSSSSAATPEMLAAAMAAASSTGGEATLKLRPNLPPRRKPSTPSHAVEGL